MTSYVPGVIYKAPSASPNDNLARLRNSIELRCLTGFKIKQHESELSVYGFVDYFSRCAAAACSGHAAARLQMEPGILSAQRRRGNLGALHCRGSVSGIVSRALCPAGISTSGGPF